MEIYKVKKPKTKCQYIPKTHQQRNNRVQTIHNKARPYNNERQIHKLKKKGSWFKFRAATLNILSAKDDIYIEQAALAMCRHSITVLAIQEARRTTGYLTFAVFHENKKYTFPTADDDDMNKMSLQHYKGNYCNMCTKPKKHGSWRF